MPRGRGRTIGPEDLSGVELIERFTRDSRVRVNRDKLASVENQLGSLRGAVKPATSRVNYRESIGGSGRDFSGFVDGTPTPDFYNFDSVTQKLFDLEEYYLTPLWYEIANARGSKVTVDTRLDISLNENGTLKQVVDDSKIVSAGLSPSSLDLTQDYDFTGYVSLKNVSGDPGAGVGSNGDLVEDQVNSKLWFKVGGSWKSVTFT